MARADQEETLSVWREGLGTVCQSRKWLLTTKTFWNNFYSLRAHERTPIIVTLTMSFFAKNLGIDLISHYANPKKYVKDSLEIIRFQHEQIKDDTMKGPIEIAFGEAFESSLFGVNPVFKHDRDPWVGKHIIRDEGDIDTKRSKTAKYRGAG